MFLLFLFKTYLDLNSCDFWFLILFLIFFNLVKINKLIFFNLDADVTFFNAKIKKFYYYFNSSVCYLGLCH